MYMTLQYASTLVGLIALAVWVVLWYQKTEPVPNHAAAPSRFPQALAIFAVAIGAGLRSSWLTIGAPMNPHLCDSLLLVFGVTSIALVLWQVLVYCLMISSHWSLDPQLTRSGQRFLMPSVSVIVNVRNGASTLREALDGALAQTFHDWELIVWDDRSTDESAQIIAEYKDPRIRHFRSTEESSLGQARMSAIRVSREEWLAFLDQDDIWLPHKLDRQMALTDSSTGLIYGRTIRFYPGGLERDYDPSA